MSFSPVSLFILPPPEPSTGLRDALNSMPPSSRVARAPFVTHSHSHILTWSSKNHFPPEVLIVKALLAPKQWMKTVLLAEPTCNSELQERQSSETLPKIHLFGYEQIYLLTFDVLIFFLDCQISNH